MIRMIRMIKVYKNDKGKIKASPAIDNHIDKDINNDIDK